MKFSEKGMRHFQITNFPDLKFFSFLGRGTDSAIRKSQSNNWKILLRIAFEAF